MIRSYTRIFAILLFFQSYHLQGQKIQQESINRLALSIFSPINGNKTEYTLPFFSFNLNYEIWKSNDTLIKYNDSANLFILEDILAFQVREDTLFKKATKFDLTIQNLSTDTLLIENVIPFTIERSECFISSEGPWSLARSKLYRPDNMPIGVILPDNAWELGYNAVNINTKTSLAGLCRRQETSDALKKRYKTYLYPDGRVSYSLYFNMYEGAWQNGLKKVFQENLLYDLPNFEDSLYNRKDLQWIRNKYLMVLQFAWDQEFYNTYEKEYTFKDFLSKGEKYCGGFDIYGLWPTWPTLGLDERNQWDLYGDLPGGLEKLAELSAYARENGTRFFISYNPWDQSTRKENPYPAMAELIKKLDADGVVLDTRGKSSYQLQKTADSVKSGVIMYSEGMAIPEDMPGIIAGRVHDAIFMPPPLNMNKLIRPDFNIFRVCQLSQGPIRREANISLFNGYGIEINTFAPGRPEWIEEEMIYLGKVIRILRENSPSFKSWNWTPLIKTTRDSIWVNKFPEENKTIYTIYSLIPDGFIGPLFQVYGSTNHYVSLWNHEEIIPVLINGKRYLTIHADPFDPSYLGTRRESSIDCIASFRKLLNATITRDSIYIYANRGDEIRIWHGDPDYLNTCLKLKPGKHEILLMEHFPNINKKIVVQLLDNDILIDERIFNVPADIPRLVSKTIITNPPEDIPGDMVYIDNGIFTMKRQMEDSFIPYPEIDTSINIHLSAFYMDKFPVTNNQFYDFIESTGYSPEDTTNFLKHWEKNKYRRGTKNEPVVYVSYEDARAYAEWAGKRLPTEAEWQYAAQGVDQRKYPWGNSFDSTLCNNGLNARTSVNQFPGGASPFGVIDLVGNIWQLTNDVYYNGSYYFIIIRGGSYYNPTSSWWYVKGGPQPLNKSQMLLRIAPGFERNATVGFRCVMDTK